MRRWSGNSGVVFQRRLATAAEFDHQLKLAKDEANVSASKSSCRPKESSSGENFTAASRNSA